MKYDVDYFIAKFEAIPEDLWMAGDFTDGVRCCAFGHCGEKGWTNPLTQESTCLSSLLEGEVARINDGNDDKYPQPTPKQRILAALRDLKPRERIVYVAVNMPEPELCAQ